MLRRFGLLLIISSAAHAGETCCVDPDIAAAFLQHYTYSREWPEGFPIDVQDPSLEFIGSSVGTFGMQTAVAWTSDLQPDAARQMVADALRKEMWRPIPQGERMQASFQRGFVSHKQMPVTDYQQYCRNQDGQATLVATASDIGTVVTLSHFANRGAQDCETMIRAQAGGHFFNRGLLGYLPVLKLPEALDLPPYAGNGIGGGSDEAHSSVSVGSAVAPETLMASFDGQMVEQGWHMDANFQGNATMGQVWLREIDGLKLACVVTAVLGDESNIRLRMHLEAT